MKKETKYCVNCGELIDKKAEIYPKCGVRVESPPKQITNHPENATLLSFFIIGDGQIYNGQIEKDF